VNICVDHIFVLTEVGAPAADKLKSLGLKESFGRVHKGQGTANRRFEFSNGFLELLWVHNAQEATTGPGAMLRLAERAASLKDNSACPFACPFGIILGPVNSSSELPFSGWSYQPEFFTPPMAFHVGKNSDQLAEPLLIYASFFKSPDNRDQQESSSQESFANLTHIKLSVASEALSEQLTAASLAHGLEILSSDEHLMELTFDHGRQGMRKDLRPDLPLIINW